MTSEYFQKGLIAYQQIFWPQFVEYDGCVFLNFDEAIYQGWVERTGGDKRRIEATMNHRHIIDILPEALESPSRELVMCFGKLLRDTWEAKLRRDFPARNFCVSFPSEDYEDLTDYQITFYQVP